MKQAKLMLFAPLLIGASLPAPKTPDVIDYGAPISYEDGVQLGEELVKSGLLDPDTAKFKWPYVFVPFTERLPLSKRTTGFATCFSYNAKNAYGGYVGYEQYRIVIRDGKVIDLQKVSDLRFVPDICKELIEKFGMMPEAAGADSTVVGGEAPIH